MAVKQLELPEIGVVKLYKRKDARSIKLSVSSAGQVRVSLPCWLPFESGVKFALSKQAWILKQTRQRPSRLIVHGQAIGKSHHVYFAASPTDKRVSARVDGTAIRIIHPAYLQINAAEVQEAAEAACIRALRVQAEALLPQRLHALALARKLPYESVRVRQLKGRWGSCDADKNIVLNLFLMQLPWHSIDYVLLHELTHTKVLHHGADFWQEFEQHLPDAKNLRKEIRTYHPVILGLPQSNLTY